MPIPLLLHGKHAERPVHYETVGPWIVPWRFESLEEEYQALRRGVGLLDYSTQAVIHVSGPDRIDFLHRLLTNDIAALRPGHGCRAALLSANAALIGDLLVLAHVDAHWLLCDATRASVVTEALTRYLFSEQVSLVNQERSHAVVALQGPRTPSVLRALFGGTIELSAVGDHQPVAVDGIAVECIRYSLTGEDGVLCLLPAELMEPLWRWLRDRGGRLGLRPVGWEALNTARLEAGLPWFGIDMDQTNLLSETGLEAVAACGTKGCYPGQEIVARLETYGSVNKKLMGLLIDEAASVPEPGDRIVRDETDVGWVTSACDSLALKRPIALGYLKRGAYEAGTSVAILRGATRLPATVAARPLVPRTSR